MNTKLFHNPDISSQYKAVFLRNGQAYLHTPTQWQALQTEPKNLTDVVIAFSNAIFGLDGQGFVWKYEGNKWEKDAVAKNVVSLASNNIGLWCVNTDGQVYVKTSPSPNVAWSKVDENIPTQAGDVTWEYIVQPGDWLWKIVRCEYGTGVDYAKTAVIAEQIKLLNPKILDWDTLQPDTKLKMPTRTN
jgi:nucleoid-associated protein YgaU